jgi:pimeloyl-ACP methyl ester carboxylesterase
MTGRVAVLLTLIVLTAPVAARQEFARGPAGSSFWDVPSRAADGAARGAIHWARERTDATRALGGRGWNIIYVSESATGALVNVSGEIYVPNRPRAGRPLIVWNHGTSGAQDGCAPSRTDLSSPRGMSRVPALDALLARGYIVAMSDYQGLGTPGPPEYLNGPSQGKAALDVARAARTFAPARAGTRVGMYGFSQGGQTSLWAAYLASTYAPELQLVGIIPVAPAARHLDLSFYDLRIPQNAGYFIARMAGLAVGHPDVRLRDILTPAGLEVLDAQAWGCYEIFAKAAGLKEPYANPQALEPGTAWRTLLEANDRFLPLPAELPILMLQGDRDVDVPVEQIRELRRDICGQGGQMEYREYAGVDHMMMNDRSIPMVADWFDARFRGDPAGRTCP